jgi:hypothetical protein
MKHTILLYLLLCGATTLLADAPIKRDKYLLLDSRLIEQTSNAKLSVGTVQKHPENPLFGQEFPWEPHFANFYGNVHYDEKEQRYRLWYNIFLVDDAFSRTPPEERRPETHVPGDPSSGGSLTKYQSFHHPERVKKEAAKTGEGCGWYNVRRKLGTCYAESEDGIRWKKPLMDVSRFRGHKSNIVYWGTHGAGIFQDLLERDPERRFKMFCQYIYHKPLEPGSIAAEYSSFESVHMSVAFSGDGLEWGEMIPCPEIAAAGDTHNHAFWAPELGKYVGITRHWKDSQVVRGGLRLVHRTESNDFIRWTKSEEILRGTQKAQTYAMAVFRYADVYLGLVMILRSWEDRIHCELAWSPDTLHWERIDAGTPLIPNGSDVGDLDWGIAFACDDPVITDDEIRLYYGAADGLHAGWKNSSLCLATLRPDGFAGYTAASDEVGVVVTRPVVCNGPFLRVNADVENGALRMGIVGDDTRSIKKSEPITRAVTGGDVRWQGVHDVASHFGKTVQLRIELSGDAKLYSIEFGS